ncbi:B12-binding domain-containing radical SAM protein [candidate division CSSED10-310 bacterium]|uniref:B12-binding domain-containing radical SAM protein n=1 Tax=candidate division CSSED10-310 bacterium TaxID=2855610 RepID=A0ABV6YZ02_UNCC1
MKILIILPDLGSIPNIFSGIASICGSVKAQGHDIKLLHINEALGLEYDLNSILRQIETFKPAIIGFSSSTIHAHIAYEIAQHIKKTSQIPIIFGGPHATVSPEAILNTGFFDFVCVGEGELAFVELLERLENKADVYSVMNIWARQGDQIFKNPLRPLVSQLEMLPYPDYDIFDLKKILKIRNGWFDVISIRGCPYRCSYCQAPRINRLYQEQKATTNGWRIQKWDIDIFISYLESLLHQYSEIKIFSFVDDVFLINKKFVQQFCHQFKEKIFEPYGVKMNVQARIETVTEEILDHLEAAGTKILKFGLESGNEEIRRKVLKKEFSNDLIEKVFHMIHQRTGSLETWAFNMIGIPGETKETVNDTFNLLAKIKPDNVWFSIYYPLPQTDLFDECVENNLIDWVKFDQLSSYREDTPLRLTDFKEGELKKMYRIFNWYLNRSLHPEDTMIRTLINQVEDGDVEWKDSDHFSQFIEKNNTIIRKKYYEQQMDYFDPRWTYISLYNDWKDNTETKRTLKQYLAQQR